jgi:predicted DNA-binding transcriptional regulator YafY
MTTKSREAGQVMARQWEMLKMLPTVGQGLEVGDIHTELERLGYGVSRRTVERDLIDLQRLFPVFEMAEGRPRRWMMRKALGVGGVSIADALCLDLVQRCMRPLLPSVVTERLQPLAELAASKVQEQTGNALRSWPSKVAVVNEGVTAIAPPVDPEVLEAVQSALLGDTCVVASYRRADGTRAKQEALSPLGLVLRGMAIYLVAANMKRRPLEPRLYPLHRMTAAQRTYEAAEAPPGFRLAEFIEQGGMQFSAGAQLELDAWVSPVLARQLEDARLSENQQIVQDEHGYRLRATVPDSLRLRWFLLSKAGDVVVNHPPELRAGIEQLLATALRQYASGKPPAFEPASPGGNCFNRSTTGPTPL